MSEGGVPPRQNRSRGWLAQAIAADSDDAWPEMTTEEAERLERQIERNIEDDIARKERGEADGGLDVDKSRACVLAELKRGAIGSAADRAALEEEVVRRLDLPIEHWEVAGDSDALLSRRRHA